MFRSLFAFLFLFCVLTTSLFAHDSEKIEQLEREILVLNDRILALEELLGSEVDIEGTKASGDRSDVIDNWRSLKIGMRMKDVKNILGEPYRVKGGAFTHWDYENGGYLIFWEEKLDSWSEPQ